MSAHQRLAWFNLGVVLLSVTTVVVLSRVIGWPAAQGGFGLLGLLGFGPLFFRRREGRVAADERDLEIQRRSLIVGYTVFWLAFVAACVSLTLAYGPGASVPVAYVGSAVWWGLAIVYGVSALATLVQYGRGADDAA